MELEWSDFYSFITALTGKYTIKTNIAKVQKAGQL